MSQWLAEAGRGVFGAVMLLTWIAACFQVIGMLHRSLNQVGPPLDSCFWKDLRGGSIAAGILLVMQGGYLAAAYIVPGWRPIAGIGWFYLVCCLPVAFLWTGGRDLQTDLQWPRLRGKLSSRTKWILVSVIAVISLCLSLLLFSIMEVTAGEAVTDISGRTDSVPALLVMVVWLVLNAPWIEELTFRHYLLPALARWWGGGQVAVAAAVILTAVVFAVGHGAHMHPAWPKLLQVGTWGLVLGYARIWLGTPCCIALHLAWNLTSPVIAALT